MASRTLLLLLALAPLPALAQTDDGATQASEAAAGDGEAAAPTRFGLDTPIQQIVADEEARAVLDRDLPGMSTDENFDQFKAMSLRTLQPLTGGQLTEALLEKTGRDLAAINAEPVAEFAPPDDRASDDGAPASEDVGR